MVKNDNNEGYNVPVSLKVTESEKAGNHTIFYCSNLANFTNKECSQFNVTVLD